MSRQSKILLTITILAIVGVFAFADPVKQPCNYHKFGDTRTLWGVPHAHNVLTNIAFLVVGAWGLLFMLGDRGRAATGQLWIAYLVFFIGVTLTAFGSAWYHLDPNNQTLIWDRLPMTILFMGLFATVIGELIDPGLARRWLLPLLVIGVGSVLYWAWTKAIGKGDLRAYGLVQFLPLLLVPLMLWLYSPSRRYVEAIVALLVLAVFAKVFEATDRCIWDMTGWVGGHAVKHVLAAAATASILVLLIARTRDHRKADYSSP